MEQEPCPHLCEAMCTVGGAEHLFCVHTLVCLLLGTIINALYLSVGCWVCAFCVFTSWRVQSLFGGVGGAIVCTRTFLGEVGVCTHAVNLCADGKGCLGHAPSAAP